MEGLFFDYYLLNTLWEHFHQRGCQNVILKVYCEVVLGDL